MSAGTLTLPRTAAGQANLRTLLPVLAVALAVFALLFGDEIIAAVGVWSASTAYNHCFFVLPIALWLAWDRRTAARGLVAQPTVWPALAMLPLALGWFAAERLGIMEGRQFAAIFMVQLLLIALLGWRLARIYAGPIAYLVFLVPFGEFLTHPLQDFTARFVDVGLDVIGIPHVVSALLIEIPEGSFYIAQACAGLRFLIAAIAFGALYVLLLYRSPGRRILFLLACIVVPVISNGLRALGIVVLGHLLGSAQAAATDHVIYGWGFFSAVILLLTAAGLPFRQDARPHAPTLPRAPQSAVRWPAAALTALAIVLLAAAGPAAADFVRRDGHVSIAALPSFAATPTCRAAPRPGPGIAAFDCGPVRLRARFDVLSTRDGGSALKAELRGATGEGQLESPTIGTLTVAGAPARNWRLMTSESPPRLAATLLLAGGTPVELGGLTHRLALAWASIVDPPAPMVLAGVALVPAVVVADPEEAHWNRGQMAAAQLILRTFLEAQGAAIDAAARATAPQR